MAVNIWTGLSGTGKTEKMFQEIDDLTNEAPLGPNIYILTPTQNTLQYEKIITANSEADRVGSLRTGVFSFPRFMWHIFNEIGSSSRETLSDSGHVMLIHKLLTTLKDDLRYYRDSSSYIKFSKKILEMLKEFRAYRVTPENLFSIEGKTRRDRDKFHDLALIYQNWQKLLDTENIEDVSLMDHFINILHQTPVIHNLEDAVIYVDGFHNFTESEFQLLITLSERVQSLTILLTHKRENKVLFRKTDSVIEHLQSMLGESSVDITQFEDTYRRSSKIGMVQLENYFTHHKNIERYEGVKVTEAPNALEEITEVAREIERLCQDGSRLSDIGIMYRDSGYMPIIDSVFRRFNIAYHIDQKVAMQSHPFIQFVIAVLDCYTRRFNFKAFMNVLKTGYLTTDEERPLIDQFENFALTRGLSGAQLFDDDHFKKMLIKNQNGDIEVKDISDATGPLIHFKNKILNTLSELYKAFDEADNVKTYITLIYQFIHRQHISDKVVEEINMLEERREMIKRDETEQAYNLFIRLLDDAYLVFKDEPISFKTFYETFIDGLKSAEFNLLPSTIDQVIIGSLDLAKLENKKHIFLIGMNRNVMPRETRSSAIIRDREKSLLEDENIILSPSAKVLAQDERFVFYLGITRATTSLYISYACSLTSGEVTKPSPYVEEILPSGQHPERDIVFKKTSSFERFDPMRIVSSAKSMEHTIHLKVRELLRTTNADLKTLSHYPEYSVWINIYQVLERTKYLGIIHRLNRHLTYKNKAEKIEGETAEALYGTPMHASVSRFESFFRCQFQHFANYGLRLNVREPYQVAPLEMGNLYHNVLEDVVLKLDKTLLHEDSVIKETVSTSIDKEAQVIQQGIFDRTGYNQSLKNRAKDAVIRLLLFMKDIEKYGDYKISHVELTFGHKKDKLGELKLTSDSGRDILLRGKIDRIDAYHTGGVHYLNLIDYKSSDRKLTKAGILNGLELQMITYMYVLMEKGEFLFSGEVRPNSMLFFPVKDPVLSISDREDLAQVSEDRLKAMRPDGAFINEHPEYDREIDESSTGLTGLLSDLEDLRSYSTYFPITVSKNGKINSRTKGRYFSPALFEAYSQYVLQKYREATDEIYEGANQVNPMEGANGTLPCSFCDFKSACQVDILMNRKDIRENMFTEEWIEDFEKEVTRDGSVDA
jgi:ATP-dependent helicase/nuclease subunit B